MIYTPFGGEVQKIEGHFVLRVKRKANKKTYDIDRPIVRALVKWPDTLNTELKYLAADRLRADGGWTEIEEAWKASPIITEPVSKDLRSQFE